MSRPGTAAGVAAHFVLGVMGGTVALWVGGPWLLGLATVAAGHAASALEGLGTHAAGMGAILAAIAIFLAGVVALAGSPVWGAGLVVRGVEDAVRRVRHAGRP